MSTKHTERSASMISRMVKLAGHPAMRTTLLIGGGGIALMIANVIYAKLLGAEDFGRLILMQSIAFVAQGILPMGFDNLIARREIGVPHPIIIRVLGLGAIIMAIVLPIAYWYFAEDSLATLIFVLISSLSGAAVRLFAAIEQSQLRFLRSQAISQAPAILFLLSAIFQSMHGISSWISSGIAFSICHVSSAFFGLVMVRHNMGHAGADNIRALWLRAVALVGILASFLLLNQLGLFVAAATLGLREVGVLGLATTMIASPFKLLSHGVGYSLLPRLAACDEYAERRKLLVEEFIIAIAIAIAGAIALFFLVPPIVDALFGDEYQIPMSLIAALIILGLIRLNTAVISSAINALAGTRSLHVFNLSGWISAAVAGAAAFALSGFGATGIIAGVAVGWLARIPFATALLRKEL